MAQRWVTEEELMQMENRFEQGGTPKQNPLQQFFEQLPPELQEKIQMLPPEKQQEVLMQLLERYQQQGQQSAPQQQFALGGEAEQVPVEAERNETLTTQDGSIPNTEGGYLERKSFNPISGQATYEIPDNEHNQTHPEGGVNMVLKEGDVVNSDKTKIPTDFKVYGKNFKNKTFKEASDFLSKKEEGIQKQLIELQKEGKADRVSENSVSIMLAKAAINRNELNELQEQVLESKKQKEHNQSLEGNIKQFGGLVKNATKAEEVYNKTLDRFLNGYTTERPVLKAEKGLSASISKMQSFTDKIAANPNMSTQDVMAAFKQSGLYNQSSESTSIYKPNFAPIKNGSSAVGNFKEMIASKESNAYKNPYIAISGINEKDAAIHSFDELRKKAASSALGKYQFVWSQHKDAIKRITGVSAPDDFRHNPEAQEKYMDWHIANQLTPMATKLKQKYNLPYSLNQIMAMIHLEGEAGLEKKIKSGTMNTSTLADNSFKNPTPLSYASHFLQGGKVYAKPGATVPVLGHEAINEFENTKGNKFGQSMQMGNNYSQSRESDVLKFITDNIGEDTWNKMPDHLKTQVYSFAFNSKQDNRVFKGLATAINPNEVYKGQQDLDVARQNLDPSKAIQIIKGADFSKPEIYNNYVDQILPQQYQSMADYYDPGASEDNPNSSADYFDPATSTWRIDPNKQFQETGQYTNSDFFKEGQDIYKNTWENRAKDIGRIYTDKTYAQKNPFTTWQGDQFTKPPAGYNTVPVNKADYSADNLLTVAKRLSPYAPISSNTQLQELIRDNYKKLTGKDITKIPFSTSNKDLIDGKFGDDWKDAIAFFLKDHSDLSAIDPVIDDSIVSPDNRNSLHRDSLNRNSLNRTRSNQHVPSKEDESDNSATQENKQSSWLDKLKYGMRESLPYLDAMRLMREGRIMPTLQQKSYQNPYDNLTTDINIQSALNDIDRQTLAGISDSTGNPSVRNARIAQLIANAQSAKSPLYTQKYNQEKQLENQKTLGQMQYYNQWEDVNRDLKKRYEQEVLQTIENQRQQKHMASNKMMNDYLRKQEQDQARDLALLETNYDWNPYSGKFEFNPKKAEQNMAYKKATFSSSSNKNSGIITLGNNRFFKKKNGDYMCLDCNDKESQNTKYGGKIKRK